MQAISDMLRGLENLEVDAELKLAAARRHPGVSFAAWLTQIADQPPLVAVSALALVLGQVCGNRRLTEAGARLMLAVVATTALKSGVERLVARTRPNAVLDGDVYRRKLGGSALKANKSFPSGHTADAVAAARALARVYPEAAGLFWAAAAFIALAQLPSGAHYPSDLLAGALVGLAGEAASDHLVTAMPMLAPARHVAA